MTREEQRLVAAARAGDRPAFDTLYQQYAGRVLAFARQLSGCRAEAEDLTQEAFVAAFRGLNRFRGQSALLTWLLGIVLRRWRDGRRRPPLLLSPASPEGGDISGPTVTRVILQDALAALPEPQRVAFLLVAAQGLTHREAAAALGEPLGTVKWRVADAARRLRVLLQDSDKEQKESRNVSPVHR